MRIEHDAALTAPGYRGLHERMPDALPAAFAVHRDPADALGLLVGLRRGTRPVGAGVAAGVEDVDALRILGLCIPGLRIPGLCIP